MVVSSVLLCWITVHVLFSEVEKRPEGVRGAVSVKTIHFKKVYQTRKKAIILVSYLSCYNRRAGAL